MHSQEVAQEVQYLVLFTLKATENKANRALFASYFENLPEGMFKIPHVVYPFRRRHDGVRGHVLCKTV